MEFSICKCVNIQAMMSVAQVRGTDLTYWLTVNMSAVYESEEKLNVVVGRDALLEIVTLCIDEYIEIKQSELHDYEVLITTEDTDYKLLDYSYQEFPKFKSNDIIDITILKDKPVRRMQVHDVKCHHCGSFVTRRIDYFRLNKEKSDKLKCNRCTGSVINNTNHAAVNVEYQYALKHDLGILEKPIKTNTVPWPKQEHIPF